MNSLQQHIIELESKVDRLYGIVERLSRQVATLTAEQHSPQIEEPDGYLTLSELIGGETYQEAEFSYGVGHKDILLDDSKGKKEKTVNGNLGQPLSTDIQVRRLTAQLTAAYNRIAALEEQLLACRIHP